MAHFEDLARCQHGFPNAGPQVLAVGWLEKGHDFTRGTCAPEFMVQLRALLNDPWSSMDFMGFHRCDLWCSSLLR